MKNGPASDHKHDDLDLLIHGHKSSHGPPHSGGSQSKHVVESLQSRRSRVLYPAYNLLTQRYV